MDLPCAGWMVYLGVDGSCKQHLKLPVLPMRVTIMSQNSGGSITRDAADLRSPDPLDRERAAAESGCGWNLGFSSWSVAA